MLLLNVGFRDEHCSDGMFDLHLRCVYGWTVLGRTSNVWRTTIKRRSSKHRSSIYSSTVSVKDYLFSDVCLPLLTFQCLHFHSDWVLINIPWKMPLHSSSPIRKISLSCAKCLPTQSQHYTSLSMISRCFPSTRPSTALTKIRWPFPSASGCVSLKATGAYACESAPSFICAVKTTDRNWRVPCETSRTEMPGTLR